MTLANQAWCLDNFQTTLTPHHGLYVSLNILLSMNIASSTLLGSLYIIMSTVKGQFSLIYHDNIIIISRSIDGHLDLIFTLLRSLSKPGVSLEMKKQFFSKASIHFQKHLIQPAHLRFRRNRMTSYSDYNFSHMCLTRVVPQLFQTIPTVLIAHLTHRRMFVLKLLEVGKGRPSYFERSHDTKVGQLQTP